MALTLTEAAAISTDQLHKGVLETFVNTSPILDRIPFETINGTALTYTMEDELPGVAWRGVNEAYPESTGAFARKSETLYILGGDADVDTFIQATYSNIEDQRAAQTALKVKALAYEFQDVFFNGDNDEDENQFDGLKTRLTGDQVIEAGENGLPIIGSSDEDRHAFFDKLDELKAAVPGVSAFYMPEPILSRVKSAARRLTMYDQTTDSFGKTVAMYDGVPMIGIGNRPDGSPILGTDEVQGTAENTGSIYAVKYGNGVGDGGVTGLTNGGVKVQDLGQLQEKPALRTRIEFFVGMALFSGKAAARLKGVIPA